MPSNLASFAIHADDVQRCRLFYEAVFHWRFEPWGPPDFYLVHTGNERKPGVQGLLHKRQQPRGDGGPNCFECTIAVLDVDKTARDVTAAGGTITMKRVTIGTVGHLIKFHDTEGNIVGAMQYDPHAT